MSDTLSITPEADTEAPVEQRLQEAAAVCLSSLDAWQKNLKDDDAKEKLMEAVHELRKVCARLEVDVAMNDRTNTNAKHIPIPEHKSKMEKRKDQKPLSEILPVAEIKKANERKKIEIEDANDNGNTNAVDDEEFTGDDGQQPMTNELPGEKKQKQQRRPRRKKKDD